MNELYSEVVVTRGYCIYCDVNYAESDSPQTKREYLSGLFTREGRMKKLLGFDIEGLNVSTLARRTGLSASFIKHEVERFGYRLEPRAFVADSRGFRVGSLKT